MIDINELRPAVEAAGLNAISMREVLDLLDRLEAAEKSDAESIAMYRRARDERDECNRRRLEAVDHFAAQTALMKEKCDELRAKIEQMKRVDTIKDEREAFREWFEGEQGVAYDGLWSFAKAAWLARAALGASNGPLMECKHTDIQRLPLYLAPGAQPKPDCGEAGHDEGRCGNAQCFSGAKEEGDSAMTRSEILKIATKCGNDNGATLKSDLEFLVTFAREVAAAEREACAKLCDDLVTPKRPIRNGPGRAWLAGTLDCAEAIRGREEK